MSAFHSVFTVFQHACLDLSSGFARISFTMSMSAAFFRTFSGVASLVVDAATKVVDLDVSIGLSRFWPFLSVCTAAIIC